MVALFVPVVFILSALTPFSTQTMCPPAVVATPLEEHALLAFNARVEGYVNIHRRVEQSLGISWAFDDPEDMFEAMYSLQSGIREARPDARRGDIFTTGIAAIIRTRLTRAMTACGYTVDEVLAFLNEERTPGARTPQVNQPFPWELGSAMPAALLAVLPELPEDLHYRFADRDLVLVDIHADLVVDILPAAL